MGAYAAYDHALASVALFAMLTLALGPMSAAAKSRDGVPSGGAPAADYASRTYRLWRAHINATEVMGAFAAVTVAAILAGAPAFWVNLCASLFLTSRLLHVAVHVAGIGAADYGLRTVLFVIGWLTCMTLGLLTLAAVFGGAA